MSSNNLNGTIPSWISSLPSLKYLDLSNNSFNGQLEEFKSKELFWIDLKKNYLQSPIPNSLLNQENLMFLSLSSNNFSDDLNFSMFSNLSGLGTLNLSYNSFSWADKDQVKSNLLYSLYDLDLRSNLLQGSLPIPPNCGGSGRGHVPQSTTPSTLDDQEEDSGFEISWEAVLMGYGCGVIIGISIIYIMSSTRKPIQLFRMIAEWEHKVITMRKKKKVARQVRYSTLTLH
ncbi:hypothetical protein H5410_014025 [Solanum commersonii]|uniref:Uncharacterized protein n=1 Tax=Solanum commersonii TaxID=4109 RepID=A0A9J5ZPU3_SOLCO|nr:hypothetical protein H5410_014025 [Solanum commersonii]